MPGLLSAGLAFAPALRAQKPVPAAFEVKIGKYNCVYYEPSGQRKVVPGFEIQGGRRYLHRNGSVGEFVLIPKKSQILFKGGSLNDTLALYDDTNRQAAFIRLYDGRKKEPIMSCQTPKR